MSSWQRTVGRLGGFIAALVLLLAGALPGRAAWIFDGRPSTWEGIPDEIKADEYVYPVFLLPLGGQWTDFELKASTNNFASIEGLVYFVQSSAPNPYADDPGVRIHFTDDYADRVLRWQASAAATPIGAQLADPVHSQVGYVLVQPSHASAVDWRKWMRRDNPRLVWSFVRYDGISLEMNATGTKSRWQLVVPVEWRKQRIAP